jgi:UDPglucose 6-dehydrogenase
VVAVEIAAVRVEAINAGQSPIADPEVEEYLARRDLRLRATLDKEEAYRDAQFVIVATPTNYDPRSKYFDTTTVEAVISDVHAIAP